MKKNLNISNDELLKLDYKHTHLLKKFTNENTFKYALKHKKIIEKFSRFPHRNKILGRKSSESELEFLKFTGRRF